MFLLPIESKMEVFARTYSRDSSVNILIGSKFSTNGKDIYIVPITDQADPWIRFMTEVCVYHETGHIITKDFPTFKDIKNKTKKSIFNIVRDICIEKHMETKYPGMAKKWKEFLSTYVKRYTNQAIQNPNIPMFQKLKWILYLRAREQQLGINVGLEIPTNIEEIFQDRLLQFIDRLAQHTTIKESLTLTSEIFEALQMEVEEEPDQDKDKEGSEDKGSEDKGSEDKGSEDKGSEDKGSEDKGSEDKNGSKPELSDEAKEALKKAQKEMENGTEGDDIGKEIKDKINTYADSNFVYREKLGLKDRIIRTDMRSGWESEVANYEEKGREMTGYTGTKLKVLFISERAPKWFRNQRSGKLDLRNLHKLKYGKLDVYKQKSSSVYEDSAVSLIIDNSGSMVAKNKIAQSLLTSISSDLDKIRIPFEALGFTNGFSKNEDNLKGIRTEPSILNLMKTFEEPYRTVRYRFVWPSFNKGTAELPAIVFAAKRLALRRETKKVLFILTDGRTETGHSILDNTMHKATKEFIARLIKAGIKIVLIGILDNNISDYGEDVLIIKDLEKFASEFYGKLMKLLL